MADLVFPTTSTPGQYPQEGAGRLINCFAQQTSTTGRRKVAWKRNPGLARLLTTDRFTTRGFLVVGADCYVVQKNACYRITDGVATLIGNIPGSLPVTIARNNRTTDGAADPQIICVHEYGATEITHDSVAIFTDRDLPTPNSVDFINGFFLFTIPDGRWCVSGINDESVSGLDFATAEANPDGLLRVVAFNGVVYLFGNQSIEIWQDVDTGSAVGVPFARAKVVTIGLRNAAAVAGPQDGFGQAPIFVGSDNVVYRFGGFDIQRISTHDVERAIAKADPSTLTACCYKIGGDAFWCLSSDRFTWEFNIISGEWEERASFGQPRWRVSQTVWQDNRWIGGDAVTGDLYVIDPAAHDEAGQALIATVESADASDYPNRAAILRLEVEFTPGNGIANGIVPTQTDPICTIQWSRNGGVTWSAPVTRSLGRQGEYERRIIVGPCGLTGPQGFRARISWSDPIGVAFLGASIEAEPRTR